MGVGSAEAVSAEELALKEEAGGLGEVAEAEETVEAVPSAGGAVLFFLSAMSSSGVSSSESLASEAGALLEAARSFRSWAATLSPRAIRVLPPP
jgi:hypothetical protein